MELNESIKQATLSFRHKINHNIRITCPECSHRRKGSNKTEPVMAVLIKEESRGGGSYATLYGVSHIK